MQKLNQMITNIDVFTPPKEYIKQILGAICDNLGYTFATVIVLDERGKGKMITSYNLPEDYLEKIHRIDAPVLSSPSGEAIETGKIVVVSDPLLDPRLKPWINVMRKYSIRTQVWVPLFRGGEAFGTYVLYDITKRHVSDGQLRTLEQIGVMVSIAITSNRYLDELMHKTKVLEVEIGERKKAESALQIAHDGLEIRVEERTAELSEANKNLQLFRNLTDKLNDFIFVVDPDTSKIIDTNASACLELGYERKELIGKHTTDFSIYLSDIYQWNSHVKQVAKDGSSVHEDMYRRKNGTTFPVEINTRLVVQDGIRLILGTVRNITERKMMDEALRASRRKLFIYNRIANVFLTSSNEDMYHDVLDIILDVMESKYGIFGYVGKNGEMICPSMSRNVWEQCQIPDKTIIFPPESWGGLWGKALDAKKPMYSNGSFNVPEGHIPMSRFLVVPIIYQDVVIGIINVANKESNYEDDNMNLLESIAGHIAPVLNARLERDYEDDERKKAELRLKSSEEKYSNLVENGNDGIVILQDEVIKFANAKMAEIVGVNKEGCIGAQFMDYVAPKYQNFERDFIQNMCTGRLSGKNVQGRYEIDILSKDCRNITVEMNGSLIEYDGRSATMGIIRDITQRKKAEKEIADTKNYLESIITMSYDGIFVIDGEGRFEFGNDAFYEIIGWPQDELVGEFFMKIFPEICHDFMIERWEEVRRDEGEPYKAIIVTKEGKRKNILVSHANMEHSYNGKCCAIVKDITSNVDEYMRIASNIVNNDV